MDSEPYSCIQKKAFLISRMKTTAAARFAANKRLDAKSGATNFGLQMVNFYTIAIGVSVLQFPSGAPNPLSLNYVSLISSVLVQILVFHV